MDENWSIPRKPPYQSITSSNCDHFAIESATIRLWISLGHGPAGNTYTSLYNQQEILFHALFVEARETVMWFNTMRS